MPLFGNSPADTSLAAYDASKSQMIRAGWDRGSVSDARAWSAVIAILLSVTAAGIYLTARIGFDNPVGPVASLVGLSLWLTTAPLLLHILARKTETRYSWIASESFLSLAVLAVTAGAGWVVPRAGFTLLPAFALAGVGGALWILYRQFRNGSGRATRWFLGAALLFSIWVAGIVWANGFLSPLIMENLILHGGTSHVDTWFLGSLTNMLELHGYPSVGLDGAAPLPYHYGSSWLFAQLSDLAMIPALHFYQIGMPVVIVPFFVRGIFACAYDAHPQDSPKVFSLYNSPLVWAILGAATVGALPAEALHSVAVWASGPILSESYTLVIPLCLLTIGAAAAFWRASQDAANAPSTASAGFFYVVFVPVILSAIGVVKVSQMVLLLLVALLLFVRLSLWKRPLAIVSVVLTCIAAGLVYQHVVGAGRVDGIRPLAFLRLLPVSWWVFFPFVHLFWTWAYVLLRLRSEGLRTFPEIRTAIGMRRLVDVEIVAAVAIIGQLPALLFDIPNANAYYFTDFQRWVSLALLLGSAPLIGVATGWFQNLRSESRRFSQLTRVVLTAALVPLAATIVFTSVTWGLRLVQDNLSTRREIQRLANALPEGGVLSGVKQIVKTTLRGHPIDAVSDFNRVQLAPLKDRDLADSVLRSSPRYAVVKTLNAIAEMPRSVRQRSILFVQPDVASFWNILPKAECIYSPLLAPSVAAVPMLDGIPPRCKFQSYVLGREYVPLPDWPIPANAADEFVCARARSRGFRRVIRIAPAPNGQVVSRSFSCAG